MLRLCAACSVAVACLLGGWAAVPDTGAELRQDEKVLREAGIPRDGAALLDFFRRRSLQEDDPKRLRALVEQLGDDSYDVRESATGELTAAGRKAMPFLKSALNDTDAERCRRARDILQAIDGGTDRALTAAAARVLAARRPEGAAAALLRYLPAASDELLHDALFGAIEQAGIQAGKADLAVIAALGDCDPLRRMAAARAAGRHDTAQHAAVRGLLADPEPAVRFEAAWALLWGGDRAGGPALAALVGEGPGELAWQAEDLLFRTAGDKGPNVTLTGLAAAQRQKAREAWETWWRANGARADLAGVRGEERERGVRLVCELAGPRNGRVLEIGADDSIRWQLEDVGGPIDVRALPGGRVLLSELNTNRVTERDRTGAILFEKKLTDSPMCAQRLANGNTFIATYTELLEVTRDNRVLYSIPVRGHRLYYASKLRNGHILYVSDKGDIIELDPATGQRVRTVAAGDTSNWGSVELLPNGHFLVARCGLHQVAELDADGREVWTCKVEWPTWAGRRSNGRTLVASAHGGCLWEFDRDGKVVWKYPLPDRRPCRLRCD
jgi:hypothetical protein